MPVVYRVLKPLNGLRRRVRASELAFILVAVGVGAGAGLLSIVQGGIARTIQHLLFGVPSEDRLSASPSLPWITLLALPIGGLALGGFSVLVKARQRRLVDAVEANALHGGIMSVPDSAVISGQTILSNGFGASVGLEAAYAQLGAAFRAATPRCSRPIAAPRPRAGWKTSPSSSARWRNMRRSARSSNMSAW